MLDREEKEKKREEARFREISRNGFSQAGFLRPKGGQRRERIEHKEVSLGTIEES